jgi:hypothetical protein
MPIPILPPCQLCPDESAAADGVPRDKGYRVLAPRRPGREYEIIGYVYLDRQYRCWRHRLPGHQEIRGSDGNPTLASQNLLRLALQRGAIEVEYA